MRSNTYVIRSFRKNYISECTESKTIEHNIKIQTDEFVFVLYIIKIIRIIRISGGMFKVSGRMFKERWDGSVGLAGSTVKLKF